MSVPLEQIRLEQAIRSKEHTDDKLRIAVLDCIGDMPGKRAADEWGISEGALSKWRSGEGTPSLRMARLVLARLMAMRKAS